MKPAALTTALIFCFAGSCLLNAQDKTEDKTDQAKAAPAVEKSAAAAKEVKKEESKSKLAGKWEGKITRQDGQEMKLTFTFKVEGEKLSGTVESPRGELEIKDGKAKDGELSFSVPIGDNTIDYQGKLDDGKIKMKSKGPMGERELTISRVVEIGGHWLCKFEIPDGDPMEITFTFKVDGSKLTGLMTYPLGDQVYRLDITEGKVDGDNVSFVIVNKEPKRETTSTYKGKVAGDKIEFTLEVQSGQGGSAPAEYDVTAKRVGS